MLALSRGPRSAPIHGYLLVIAVANLISGRVSVVWFTTAICCLGYLTLVAISYFFTPENLPPFDAAAGLVTSLLAMGLLNYLQIRRTNLHSRFAREN